MKPLRDSLLLFLILSTLSTSLFLLFASRTLRPQTYLYQTCSLVAASIVTCCCLFLFIVTFNFNAPKFQEWVERRGEVRAGKRRKKPSPLMAKRKGGRRGSIIVTRVSSSAPSSPPLSSSSDPIPFLASSVVQSHLAPTHSGSLGPFASSPETIIYSSLDDTLAASPASSPASYPLSSSPAESPLFLSSSPLSSSPILELGEPSFSDSPPIPRSVLNNVVKALSASSEPDGFKSPRYRNGTHDKFEKMKKFQVGSPVLLQRRPGQ